MSFRLQSQCYSPLMFVCYSASPTHVIEKYVLLALCLQNLCYYPLCSYVTLSSEPMSLNNMFFWHFVSKSHVLLSHTKASPR